MTYLDNNAITSAFLLDNKIRVMENAEVTYADDVTETAGTGTIRFAYEKAASDATTFHVGVRPAISAAGTFAAGQFVKCFRDNTSPPAAINSLGGTPVITDHEMTIGGMTYVYVTLTLDNVETGVAAYQFVIDADSGTEVNLFGLQIELN